MRKPKAYTPMHHLADRLTPKLAWAIRQSFRDVAMDRVTHTALAAGLSGGTVNHVVQAIQWHGIEEDFHKRLAAVFLQAVHLAANASVEKAAPATGSLAFRFDLTNPLAIRWAQTTAADLALNLTAEAQQAIRSTVVQMFEDGIPPAAAARRLRAMIGLDRRYATAVLTYQRDLTRNATLPATKATELVTTYAQRLATQRAETIARTESIRAAVKGQQLAWQQRIAQGTLDASRIRQAWIVTPDDRLCPVCAAIPGAENVFGGGAPDNQPAVGDPFYVPATGEYISGPPQHPSCRCDVALVIQSTDGAFVPPQPEFPAYAGADAPPVARTLQPRVPLRYR